jgi:DNA repair protein RadC
MSALQLVQPLRPAPPLRTRRRAAATHATPVDRLHHHGPAALTDQELVALVLQTRPSAGLVPAAAILTDCGGLPGLRDARPADLVSDGVGPSRAAAVAAAVELGRRLARQEMPERKPMSRPGAVASYLVLRYRLRDQEVMGALYLDTRHRLIEDRELYRGTLSRAAVEPREILKHALLRGAAGIVLFHTHPSGDPSPSLEDLAFTRRMAEAGDAVGVRLIDHLILGSTARWVSLKERGAW